MLLLAGAPEALDGARELAAGTLRDGSAWAKFREFVEAQKGDVTQLEAPELLPPSPIVAPLLALPDAYTSRLDAREVGYVAVSLGGGRARKGDPIDPAVGVQFSRAKRSAQERKPGSRCFGSTRVLLRLWQRLRRSCSVHTVSPMSR